MLWDQRAPNLVGHVNKPKLQNGFLGSFYVYFQGEITKIPSEDQQLDHLLHYKYPHLLLNKGKLSNINSLNYSCIH